MNREAGFGILFFSWLLIVFFPEISAAKKLVSLKVEPAHVGVFYEIKTQQFKAVAIFNDGSRENYTDKVGWSLKAYPFSNQTKKPDQIARINKKGFLTVLNTWGRVKVLATYPPPVKFSPSTISIILLSGVHPPPASGRKSLPAVLGLLLLNDDKKVVTGNTSLEVGQTFFTIGSNISNGEQGDTFSVNIDDDKDVERVVVYGKENQRIELVRFFRYTGEDTPPHFPVGSQGSRD